MCVWSQSVQMQTIQESGLQPTPGVAVLPLGTGNNLARYFGWGKKFNPHWLAGVVLMRVLVI